jgi:hypothetical protein
MVLTPNMATLITTLAFSSDVRIAYVWPNQPFGCVRRPWGWTGIRLGGISELVIGVGEENVLA